jgi:nucleoside-diphosphate-sugar epimerase
VIHCACAGVFRLELSLDQARLTNVSPLEVLFEGLARDRGSRLIHAGSAFVLEAGRSLNESARIAPCTNYARSKAEADRRIEELAIGSPVNWFNLRLFHTYGAYEAPERLFPYLVTSLTRGRETRLSSGEQIRDFNNVESIAGAFLLALEADGESAGGLYHIGSGNGRSVRDFARSVAEIVGHPDRLRFDSRELHPGEVTAWVSDPSRAREDLGWRPLDEQRELREATRRWADRLKVAS